MARKPRTLTAQESLIATFAKHSISSRSTFHPDLWSSGHEPADMVIVIGRALLLFNMTASKKTYFAQLCDHNLEQARDRIEEWKAGRQIRGKNEWQSFVIHWSDVDYIHVVSVVDGDHAACADHPLDVVGMDPKVRLCTTVSSRLLRELAIRGGGARDLIFISRQILEKAKVSEKSGIRLVRNLYNTLLYAALERVKVQPSRMGRAIIGGKEVSAFEEYRHTFESTRRTGGDGSEIFSDLAWVDIFPAIAFIVESIAEMEWREEGQIRSAFFGQNTRFQIVVSTNTHGMKQHLPILMDAATREGAAFTFINNLMSIGAAGMFAVSHPPSRLSTELDLAHGSRCEM